jgi:hypothetical protein
MCFDISATKILDDGDVKTPTIFDCELKIPEAQYAVRKSIVYYPGKLIAKDFLNLRGNGLFFKDIVFHIFHSLQYSYYTCDFGI